MAWLPYKDRHPKRQGTWSTANCLSFVVASVICLATLPWPLVLPLIVLALVVEGAYCGDDRDDH